MDEIKNQEEKKQEAEAVKNLMDPGEQLRLVRKGKMKLSAPIQDGERTVEELSWDFGKLTGLEYAEALDSGDGQNNFRITNTQALCLFAAAAAKVTEGLSAREILKGLDGMDAPAAIRVATIFFTASFRVGNRNISEV